MPDITTTPLRIEHVPACRRLYALLIAEKNVQYPILDEPEFDRFVQCLVGCLLSPNAMEQFPCWAALDGDTVVGFLFGERETRPLGRPRDFVSAHWMVVDPAYRKRGVGRLLLTAGYAWLIERGIEYLECATFSNDNQWEAWGFTPILTRYMVSVSQLPRTLVPGAKETPSWVG